MSLISKCLKGFYTCDNFVTGGLVTRKIINVNIQEYGELLVLEIEQEKKYMYVKVILNGDDEPIDIHIDKYSVSNENTITIHEARCTKNWVAAVLKNFVIDKAFDFSRQEAEYVKDFL